MLADRENYFFSEPQRMLRPYVCLHDGLKWSSVILNGWLA